MKVPRIDHSIDSFQHKPGTSRPSLRDAFNASAASMGVLGSMPLSMATTPLSMSGAAGIAAAMASLPPAPPKAPRKDSALSFNPASMSGASLLNGLLDSSFAAAIMKSAAEGDAANLSLLLAKRDTLPDFTNAHGISPLMAAATRGQVETAELLASHPLVNLARADGEGWTALHFAAHLNQQKVVALLLKHHAPFDMETAQGQVAFDLGDAETQAEFLKNANVRRFLKSRDPAHPALAEAIAAAPEHPPEPAPLPQTFYDALKEIGIALQKGAPLNVRDELNTRLARMPLPELAKAYRSIAQTQVKYDWDTVFIRAAENNNTNAMVFLQDEIYFDQRVLDRALQAAAKEPRNRNAVHHLIIWEANPHAKVKTATGYATAIDTAGDNGNTAALEEIVLWSSHKQTEARIDHFMAQAREKLRVEDAMRPRKPDDGSFMAMISVSALLLRRQELAKMGANGQQGVMAAAAAGGNITDIMAAYAQGHAPRFLHRSTQFAAPQGGAAMGWALVFGKMEFARKLAADGYRLADAPKSLQEKVLGLRDAEAAAFGKENLAGTKHYPRIEETGKRSTSPSAIRQLRTGLYID